MFRRDVLRAGAAVGLAGVAGCVGGTDDPAFTEGFEDGIGDWEREAAIGPEVDLEDFEWTTPELSTDTLHFAVGTAVIWEADATHYVDDLSVTIERR